MRITTSLAHRAVLGLVLSIACEASSGGNTSADDTADDAASAGDATGGDGSCDPNTSDGNVQCTHQTCVGGQFCEWDGFCASGCASSLNCAAGEYCDLRMPAPNGNNTFEIGICRTPGTECGASSVTSSDPDTSGAGLETGVASCDDVQGNYVMELDASSPDVCNEAFSNLTMCSVAQDGCQLTWGCDADFALSFPPGPIDGSVYHGSGVLMGVPFECTIEWVYASSFDFSFSCAANVGEAVVCEGTGA